MFPSSYSFSKILSGTQFAYTVDVFIPLAPQLASSLVFSISLFPATEISSYLLFILLSFFLSYFETSFKNTHRILGNGRVGNSKGLVFHRNKENLTKMIFIRTQRLTATKWSLSQLKKKKERNQWKHRKRDVWHFNLSLFHPPYQAHWWSVGSWF